MEHYSCFIHSVLTFFSPWLVSQEATLLFPDSSGMDGGFSSSVPLADALSPSLLSWLPGAERCEVRVRRLNWNLPKHCSCLKEAEEKKSLNIFTIYWTDTVCLRQTHYSIEGLYVIQLSQKTAKSLALSPTLKLKFKTDRKVMHISEWKLLLIRASNNDFVY